MLIAFITTRSNIVSGRCSCMTDQHSNRSNPYANNTYAADPAVPDEQLASDADHWNLSYA